MPERRADALKVGDRLELKGEVWTVVKVKVKGKLVKLGVQSRRGSFVREVKAKARYTVVGVAPGTPGLALKKGGEWAGGPSTKIRSGPLLDLQGAQTRWAQPEDLTPPAEAKRTDPWAKVPEADRVLIDELGAKLLGVEVEGGKLVVPPVTDATIFGHLLTMHGVRFDGATFAEAKAWAAEHDPAGTKSADEVLGVLDFEQAYALHESIHGDLAGMKVPHWHRKRAPK